MRFSLSTLLAVAFTATVIPNALAETYTLTYSYPNVQPLVIQVNSADFTVSGTGVNQVAYGDGVQFGSGVAPANGLQDRNYAFDASAYNPNPDLYARYGMGYSQQLYTVQEDGSILLQPGSYTLWFDVAGGPQGRPLTIVDTTPPAPTPEPSSLVLLGTGVLGVAGFAKRRLSA